MTRSKLLVLCAGLSALLILGGCQPATQDAAPASTDIATQAGPMVLVPAGSFARGSESGEADEKPVKTLQIDAFLMDKYEVTQAEYARVTGERPAKFEGDALPLERVSLAQAVLYCNGRSEAEGLTPCYDPDTGLCDFTADGYRLPTEAEWEYACRAGSEGEYAFGDDANTLPSHAWYQANSGERTHPVGEKRPNAWGLHDMHGNVAEWCNDVYAEDYYAEASEDNPKGPPEPADPHFVTRGGSWNSGPEACRAAYRAFEKPGQIDGCFAREDLGFRCVRRPAPADGGEPA
ncbi:MAG: formylglycine-generating enzyme family protein [Candidatus Hydrogenedentes bacterium]|nr:formylglycine-generating enzyme family protein [Candidatus Hydrogenedentota bacterium]